MVSDRVHEMLPEWDGFARAVQARRPGAGTWCESWTVRDILVHNTGNADELARVLAGRLTGSPVATRGFEERERQYREAADPDLWAAFARGCERLVEVCDAAVAELRAGEPIEWTGRR